MTAHPKEAEFGALITECKLEFCGPMNSLLQRGLARGLPGQLIATAIAMTAIRCAALAIVSANLDPANFEQELNLNIEAIRASIAARQVKLQ